MGPGDIDRELCAIRDDLRISSGAEAEYECLRRAYGLGLRQGRAVEQMIVAEEKRLLAEMAPVGIQKVEIYASDLSVPARIARAVKSALTKIPPGAGA